MGLRYNPFNGSFDFTGSGEAGGGGGGASYIDGEVQNFSALPETPGSPPVDSAYLVREAEGTWLINRNPAGIYIRTANTGTRASDWTYAGAFPDVFNDANFLLYDNADSTKNLGFQLSGITTGTTRTLTVPDKSGTIATTDAGDMASGTLADARLSANVPLKDEANTFTQNQTLNGTNNVAPNQTAASGTSLMTRDLMDALVLETRVNTFRDDFANGGRTNGIIGETGWVTSNAGGGSVIERQSNGVFPNHTAYRITTGATANNYLRIYTLNGIFGTANPSTIAGWHAVCILALPNVNDVTVSAGFSQDPTNIDFNSRLIGVRYKAGVDTNWQFVTKNDAVVYATSTAITLVDSTVAPVANTFYKFEFRCVTAGTVEFRIDGGSWLTSTTNIPTSLTAGLFYILVGTQTSSARTCDVDLVAWKHDIPR